MGSKANNLYEFGDFRLDVHRATLWRGSEVVLLSPKALELLTVLIQRNGEVVSKQEIFQTVWADTFVEDGVLTQNIYTLRNALGPDENGKQLIETIPRRGYRFAGKVLASDPIVEEQADIEKDAPETDRQFGDELPASRRNLLFRPLLFSAGIILSVAALGFGVYEVFLRGRSARITDPAPIEQVRLQRLTDSGDVIHPTISPNGEMLAYVRQEEHGEGLWIEQIATGNSFQTLPLSSKGYRSLTFSPDGSYLFFRELAAPASIFQTSPYRGTPKKVADNVWSDFSVSPDGRQFAFMRRDAERDAYLLILSNVDGSGERELSVRTGPSNYSDIAPAWSPDGAKLVAVAASQQQTRPQLVSLDTTTGQESELKTPGWRTITRILWTPDGKHLVVAARALDEATSQLWMLDVPDGTVRRLTNDLEAYFWLSLSADGRRLVTRQQGITAHLWILPDGNINKAKQLTTGERNLDGYRGLEWSADGRIIFTPLVGHVTDLYSIDADGSNKVQLTANAGADNTYPATSTDGRYIIFTSQRTGTRQIWRMDADGRNQKQLTFGKGSTEAAYAGELSSDGTEVFFIKQGAGPSAIWKVSIDGGDPIPVSRLTNATAEDFLSMSPDRKWLAFRYVSAQQGPESDEQTMRIGVLAADGSGETRFFDLPILRPFVRWTTEGTFDYAAGTFKSATITRQTINGGDPKKLVDFPDRVFDFAWSRDGKNLAVSRGRVQGDAVLITNLP